LTARIKQSTFYRRRGKNETAAMLVIPTIFAGKNEGCGYLACNTIKLFERILFKN